MLVPAGAGANAQPCGAGQHGSPGYAYAGHESTLTAHGVRATITPLSQPLVPAGHVAGWVGVGGPGQGANGEALWLQAGVVSLPNTPAIVYAEITRAGQAPVFVAVLQNVKIGESHKLAVLEMNRRPNWWRVWVDGRPVTEPVHLPGAKPLWRPMATAESWNGGQAICNRFAFRFDGVAVAQAKGGVWRPFAPGFRFQDRGFIVKQLAPAGQRTLAAGGPSPYAFEASSL
jgi:hypothetical protein